MITFKPQTQTTADLSVMFYFIWGTSGCEVLFWDLCGCSRPGFDSLTVEKNDPGAGSCSLQAKT